MVGIVLVSHSRALAEALARMARQVSARPVPLAIAAGVGPGRQELGTDASEVAEAIQAVDRPEGVLVLVDLGSALLSAEMALDFLPPEVRDRVLVCPAPLVEGALAAAVQAGLGSDLPTVCREALAALQPKQEQLSSPERRTLSPFPQATYSVAVPLSSSKFPLVSLPPTTPQQEILLTLTNPHGLHARPAARFVQTAAGFDAQVQVRDLTNGRGPVPASSLNSLATLGAVQGHQIAVSAWGPQASQVLPALARLVESGFGEAAGLEAGAQAGVPALAAGEAIQAIPLSEGAALGPLYPYHPQQPRIPSHSIADPAAEWDLLEAARAKARRAIAARRSQVAAGLGEDQAAIFDAHLLILNDPVLLEEVRQSIWADHRNAAAAWQAGITALAREYAALDDTYLQQRAADLLDVGNAVLQALAGSPAAPAPLPGPVILLAEEIVPSQMAQLDLERVLGLVTVLGGPASHSAVLARSLGIPAVTGAPAGLLRLPEGTPVGIDGSSGAIWVEPSEEVRARLQARREAWLDQRTILLAGSRDPAVTRDGRAVVIAANAGSLQDARLARRNGAEGIGVLRTEFLFLDRREPPSEDEQAAVYIAIGEAMEGLPVTVRTLDAGGDKDLPFLQPSAEANPYLGVRGLRLSLVQPELFKTQLRAILRAGERYPLRILLPMVTHLDEVLRAREILEAAHRSLEAQGLPHRWPVELGIMIEVPAAALLAPVLAPQVDFFSIGTNDLTQYTLAAERGNPHLASFSDALHPAVLRLVQGVVEASRRFGRWAGVCGEIAGDPLAAPALVGLEVDELSLNPAGIPEIKAAIRSIRFAEARALAARMLAAGSAAEARKMAEESSANLP